MGVTLIGMSQNFGVNVRPRSFIRVLRWKIKVK